MYRLPAQTLYKIIIAIFISIGLPYIRHEYNRKGLKRIPSKIVLISQNVFELPPGKEVLEKEILEVQ
jgi:hypothetical protein